MAILACLTCLLYIDPSQLFDKRGCGYIGVSDILAILQCMGEEVTEEMGKQLVYIQPDIEVISYKHQNTQISCIIRYMYSIF